MKTIAIILCIIVSCLTISFIVHKNLSNPEQWSKYLPKIVNQQQKSVRLLSFVVDHVAVDWQALPNHWCNSILDI